MRTEQARPVRLQDYRPPDWLVDTVDLDVSLHPSATRVRSRPWPCGPIPPASRAAPLRARRRRALAVVARRSTASRLPDDAYVGDARPPDHCAAAAAARSSSRSRPSIDPSANTQLMGLYRSNGTYCTQCEAEGFRRITYFPDRPDVMAVYTTRIEADTRRGAGAARQRQPDREPAICRAGGISRSGTIRFRSRPICSRWSAATSAASTTRFVTMSGRKVALKIYVEPGKEDRCGYAMDSLKRSMRWDEEAFGREYDLDIFMIVAVSDFNMGAMENKGLNVFNDKYVLASPETATDGDYAAIEAIIAHEYFHNWTGNRITCRDWFQLCLKEGLTVFRDQEFSVRSALAPGEAHRRRAASARASIRGGCRPPRPSGAAGALSRDQQFLHGDRLRERRRSRAHAARRCSGPQTSAKAWTSISSATTAKPRPSSNSCTASPTHRASDLTQFMRWYSQAGTPEVTANGNYDAGGEDLQAQPRADARADARTADEGADGDPARARPRRPRTAAILPLRSRRQPVSTASSIADRQPTADDRVRRMLPEQPVLSINRGFSAPVKLVANLRRTTCSFSRRTIPIRSTAGRRCRRSRLRILIDECRRRSATARTPTAMTA